MENYIEFKRTLDKESINAIAEIFHSNQIEFIVEDAKPSVDITFTNSGVIEYLIKVKQSDFEKASELLASNIEDNLEIEDYYLNYYNDEELIEVISLPNDSNRFDIDYANKLIEKRGIVINENKLEKAKLKKENELLEPEKAKSAIILGGYLLSILGGWIGLIVAMHLKYKKKEIEGRESVFYYDPKSRSHGDTMLILVLIWALIWFVYFNI